MSDRNLPREPADDLDTVSVDFDHHSREHAADPYGSFKTLREQCPFAHSSRYGGFWVATRWEEVARIASDPESFTSGLVDDGTRATHIPRDRMDVLQPPTELEPPEFVAYRRLVEPHASPKAVMLMEPGVHYWTDWFIDRVIERGSMKVTTEFAMPVPSSITVDWLGLPTEDWRFYWSAVHNPDTEEHERDLAELLDRLRTEIASRRDSPRPDLLTEIANGTVNGGLIDVERAVGLTRILLAGGTETTGDLFAHALLHLDQHRDVHRRLVEDDRFLRTATEEYLRMSTPVLSNGRVAKCPVGIQGQTIEKGDQILLGWASANRDPAVFEDPEEVDLERWPNRHVAFGIGPHRCLGSNLARMMFKVMVRRFLTRLPDFRVVAAEPVADRALFASFARLEVEFTPGPRLLSQDPPPPQFQAAYADGTQASQR